MRKRDDEQIIRDHASRQSRQLFAISITLLLVLFFVLLYRRPDIFGGITRNSVVIAQLFTIFLFIGFSMVNWRCPSCRKYLGGNINKRICNKCGTRLR